MSESRAQRQAALEERRRRIAELREARSRRQEDTARVQASATANLDDFVTGLLNEPSPVPVAEEEEEDVETQTSSQQQEAAAATPESGSATGAAAETPAAAPVAVAPVPAPKQVETFTIGTQTDDIEEEPAIVEDEDEEELEEKDEQPEAPAATEMIQPKVLSPQELEKEVTAPQFTTFLNTASKNVERMLTAADIWQKASDPLDASSAHGSTTEPGQEDTQKFLTDRVVFEVDKWTSGRDITDIDWQSRELFLSTYGSRSAKTVINTATTRASSTPSDSLTPRSGELQSDGLVALWSLMLPPNRPEHILTCASPVQSGRFHPTERNLVVGGCASGQVVVWDVRAGKLPVQTSASVVGGSSGGHVHPVCQMEVLDGGVC